MADSVLLWDTISEQEHKIAALALIEIQAIYDKRLVKLKNKNQEFFEPSNQMNHFPRAEIGRKIKYFNQNSMINLLLFKHENLLKLMASSEMYLISINQNMPLMTYISARYLLELLATINLISEELMKTKETSKLDWASRGEKFLSILLRARNSVSDPYLSDIMKGLKFQKKSLDPFNITNAIQALSKTSFFPKALEYYNKLSNFSHHNGTSTTLFQQSIRKTDNIKGPNGSMMIMPTSVWAITLNYPSENVLKASIHHTSEMVLNAILCIENLLENLPHYPFSKDEITELTKGAITQPVPYYESNYFSPSSEKQSKIKQNEKCTCGSGKKFKYCCSRIL